MSKGYQVFLMVELARIANIIPKELEYDTTWERAEILWFEFFYSPFNKSTEPEYECIEAFLKSKVEARLEELRAEIIAERISMGEILELQSLVKFIDSGDVLLLEWAGVEENRE